jgi:hypothetical protein
LSFVSNEYFSYIRYRHELFGNGFGIEWIDDSDDEPTKIITEESINDQDLVNNPNPINSKQSRSVITVRSIDNNATRLPAHIWRSLAKVEREALLLWNKIYSFRLYPVMLLWN